MSSNSNYSTPILRLALFGGVLLASVAAYSVYREWVRRKEEAKTKQKLNNLQDAVTRDDVEEDEIGQVSSLSEDRRQLLEQQDMEYIISEQMDAEKDRQKALKEEEKRRRLALDDAGRVLLIETLRKKHASLPPVPVDFGQHILELTVMIPEEEHSASKPQRVSRKWNAELDTLEDVFVWVETLALPEYRAHNIPQVFTLRSDFPRVRYARADSAKTSLKSLGLTGRVVLHIEETLNESS